MRVVGWERPSFHAEGPRLRKRIVKDAARDPRDSTRFDRARKRRAKQAERRERST